VNTYSTRRVVFLFCTGSIDTLFVDEAGQLPLANLVGSSLDLYRILSRPTLYGVWLTKGGSGRSRLLRNGRAIVLQ